MHVIYTPYHLITAKVGSTGVYGHSKTIQKSRGYNPHPYCPNTPNLFACVDKSLVAWKKWFINQAMNETMMRSFEPCISTHVGNLCEAILEVSGAFSDHQSSPWAAPRDMADWSRLLGGFISTLADNDCSSLLLLFGRRLGLDFWSISWFVKEARLSVARSGPHRRQSLHVSSIRAAPALKVEVGVLGESK